MGNQTLFFLEKMKFNIDTSLIGTINLTIILTTTHSIKHIQNSKYGRLLQHWSHATPSCIVGTLYGGVTLETRCARATSGTWDIQKPKFLPSL